MLASISTLFMSRFRSSIDRIEGRERDAARAHISAVKVWMVTLARAASAATQPISVEASRSFIAQPDESSTACFGPGTLARPRIVARSERSTGWMCACASWIIVLVCISTSVGQSGALPRHSRPTTSARTNMSWESMRIASQMLMLYCWKGGAVEPTPTTRVSASATLAWSAVKSTLGPGAGKVRRPIRSLAGMERTHFCAEPMMARASLRKAGLIDHQQDDPAVLLGLVRRDLGIAGGRLGLGGRRRVLDEIDRDDLTRLAARSPP